MYHFDAIQNGCGSWELSGWFNKILDIIEFGMIGKIDLNEWTAIQSKAVQGMLPGPDGKLMFMIFPCGLSFKGVMPDMDEPLACDTVEIFGAGIVKVKKSDLRYVCRSVLADKGQ